DRAPPHDPGELRHAAAARTRPAAGRDLRHPGRLARPPVPGRGAAERAAPADGRARTAAAAESAVMDMDEIVGSWDYRRLPDNIRIGADCFLERRESFERFRSRQSPGLVLGDRVQVLTWTTFNVKPSGRMEIGEDTVLVGAVF